MIKLEFDSDSMGSGETDGRRGVTGRDITVGRERTGQQDIKISWRSRWGAENNMGNIPYRYSFKNSQGRKLSYPGSGHRAIDLL